MDENKVGADRDLVDWMTELRRAGQTPEEILATVAGENESAPFFVGGMSLREERLADRAGE